MADLSDFIGNADLFPVLRKWNYLNHAGIGPSPKVVADAIRKFADESEAGAYLDCNWFAEIDKTRAAAAALLNADVGEIALVKNTSEGISIVARGIDLSPGDRIVLPAVEYPANVYPWMEAAKLTGAELVMVPEETDEAGRRQVPPHKLLAAADHPKTKVLALSHVQYASGQRFDLESIGQFCQDRNILFSVDAIQSLGVVPVDVKKMKISYLSACGHKWLMGPAGAGIFYIDKSLLERTRPLLVGATSVVDWANYGDLNYTLLPTAARYESGTPNIPGLLGLGAAIAMFNAITLNPIAERLKSLGDRLIAGLELKNYKIVSPRAADRWSGMVCFTTANHDQEALTAMLRKQHRIEILVREKRLRCSPQFYNTEAQIDALLDALPVG